MSTREVTPELQLKQSYFDLSGHEDKMILSFNESYNDTKESTPSPAIEFDQNKFYIGI